MINNSVSRCFRLSLIALSINQIFTHAAFAVQTDAERIADLEKKLAQSMQQIQELSARLTQLEAAKPAQPAINTTAIQEKLDSQNARIEQIEKNVEQTAESTADQSASQMSLMGVPVHGFLALGYSSLPSQPSLPNTLNQKSGFTLSNVDFYLTPNFGDKMKALMELNYEYTDQGILTFDLERFQVGYTFSDALTLWAGRFHTPFGVWNTAFHHGPYIQVSTERPRFVAFEDQGGIMPSHTVGVLGSGTFRLQNGDRINYDAFVGNGSRIIPASDGNTVGIPLGNQLDFNPVGDDNSSPAVGGRISYVMSNGLTLGLHALSETVNTYDMNNVQLNSTKVSFFGGFYFYESDNWESIAEYYRFSNKDDSGGTGTHSSWAAFAQVSYAINNLWTPYVRYEKAALDQTDNYFGSLQSGRSYDRQVLGLRWDFNKSAALKFEYNRTNEQELDGSNQKDNEYRIQYSVKF